MLCSLSCLDVMFFASMAYLTTVLLQEWSLYTCKQPLNVWLLGTYAYLTITHILGVITRSSQEDVAEMIAICVYFFVLVPFSVTWTILGTVWYSDSSFTCVPEYLQGMGLLFILMISYLYVSIGLALLLMFSMMYFARQQALSDFSVIVVPNDDRRLESLSESLMEQLDSFTFTVSTQEFKCPICFEDFAAGVQAVKLPACEHEMHWECVREWFLRKSTCPVCRADVAAGLRAAVL